MKAISVRQPWAHLIIHGGKDIENRDWRTNMRGTVFVHASKGMTRKEYDAVSAYVESYAPALPAYEDLKRGGIIGTVDIVDCVTNSASPWFMGKYGFVLTNPRPIEFRPYRGELGFFVVTEGSP